MGLESGWIANPAFPGRPEATKRQNMESLPAYERDDDDHLGTPWDTAYGFSVNDGTIRIDPEIWIEGPDHTLYVGGNQSGLVDLWVARGRLGDRSYKTTVTKIQAAYEAEALTLAPFWAERQAQFEPSDGALKTVTLPKPLQGIKAAGEHPVTVPAGTYTCQGTEQRKIPGDRQVSPFSVLITVGDELVLVNPDTFWGIVDDHIVEAERQGLANRLSAKTIRALFEGTKSPVGPYVPQSQWLLDEHVHYVTADQMGAVFVLNAMPATAEAVEEARKKESALFDFGADTPGVRFGDHIFIQLDQLGIGVEYHEAVHRLSHPATLKILGWGFNEGATEYFTRKLLAGAGDQHKMVRPEDQYQSQHDGFQALIDLKVLTEEDLAQAYFAGKLQPLFVKAANRLGSDFSLQAYALHLQGGYASAAVQALQEAVG